MGHFATYRDILCIFVGLKDKNRIFVGYKTKNLIYESRSNR